VGEGDEPVDGLGFEDFDKTEKKIMEREKNMQEKKHKLLQWLSRSKYWVASSSPSSAYLKNGQKCRQKCVVVGPGALAIPVAGPALVDFVDGAAMAAALLRMGAESAAEEEHAQQTAFWLFLISKGKCR
jgi:hypothetical protein